MRLFLAIPLTNDWRQQLAANSQLVHQPIRWLPPANWHITVVFFGEVPAEKLSLLKIILAEVIAQQTNFTLNWRQLVIKQNNDRAMLWAEFIKSAQFTNLVKLVQVAVDQKVFKLEPEIISPIPHITLARWQTDSVAKVDLQKTFNLPKTLTIQQLVLYQSRRDAHGSHYSALAEFNFPPSKN